MASRGSCDDASKCGLFDGFGSGHDTKNAFSNPRFARIKKGKKEKKQRVKEQRA
jgi:hypothetical protein